MHGRQAIDCRTTQIFNKIVSYIGSVASGRPGAKPESDAGAEKGRGERSERGGRSGRGAAGQARLGERSVRDGREGDEREDGADRETRERQARSEELVET